MVQEFRQIMLSKQEVMQALEAHNRMIPHYLPYGKVTGLKTIDSCSLFVTTMSADLSQEKTVIFDDQELLQAVIRFCLENNIMLPRSGRKSVAISDTSVSLCIRLDIDTQMLGITSSCLAALCAAAM